MSTLAPHSDSSPPRDRGATIAALLLTLMGCGSEVASVYEWRLPPGFPEPSVPADNPMSEAKVVLGRHLFYDSRLSGNETQACASCHLQRLAFSDGLATSVGSTGQRHPRNSLTLTNSAYSATLTWANPVLVQLEQQIPVPMFGELPVELGLSGREEEVLSRLGDEPRYPPLFREAFPDAVAPIAIGNVVKALASFVRTLISGESPFDRFVYSGERAALSESARRGMELFFSERLECFHCHGGFNFTQSTTHAASSFVERPFHNTGLFNIGGDGSFPADNQGLIEFTERAEDMGRFRAPTLRNVELTGPYMHDGSLQSLDDVLDFYARGGRWIESGPNAGDGRDNPFKSEFVRGFSLSPGEKADLLAFLRSLTDGEFVGDRRHANPWSLP